MSNEDLSSVLWRERDLLELLLFKLEVEQLVLTSGMTHWLAIAAKEVEGVLQEVRDVELRRALAVDSFASELGLSPNASLSEIAFASEEPWRAIWLDHREAFTAVAVQISETSECNRVLLTAGPA
ncbi:MAG: flagellar export chaperone FlgN [Nocardioidaceae bacterium]